MLTVCANTQCYLFRNCYSPDFTHCDTCSSPLQKVTLDEFKEMGRKFRESKLKEEAEKKALLKIEEEEKNVNTVTFSPPYPEVLSYQHYCGDSCPRDHDLERKDEQVMRKYR